MGPEGAVNVVFRRELKAAVAPDILREELVHDYREKFSTPYIAAARGYLDGVIMPRETRPRVIRALEMLRNKRVQRPPRKHGNMPL
jgi:propionyl-CoA carboxylase beta chain